jgi:hypothetical protein
MSMFTGGFFGPVMGLGCSKLGANLSKNLRAPIPHYDISEVLKRRWQPKTIRRFVKRRYLKTRPQDPYSLLKLGYFSIMN